MPKLCIISDNAKKKYCGVGQATDDNMALCALHDGYQGCKHTLSQYITLNALSTTT